MKKAASLFLAAILGMSLIGCGGASGSASSASAAAESAGGEAEASGESRSYKIGFSDFSLSAEYQAKLRDKFVEAVADKFGDSAEVIVVDGESDSDPQNSGIDNLIVHT